MKTPIIGITLSTNPDGPEAARRVFAPYAEAVEAAGGQSMFLDSRPISPEEAAEIVKGLDGLLLSGGKDVHPSYFHTDEWLENLPGGVEGLIRDTGMSVDDLRDEFEIVLVRAALDADIPIMGICRGLQMLNVVLGGSLVLDIDSPLEHRSNTDGTSERHEVEVFADTMISKMLGAGRIEVNSRHHQGLQMNELSEHLIASAAADDGVVEAAESRKHSWVIAVQWHPERQVDEYLYEKCRPLFRSFVEASAKSVDHSRA
ncbi:MAG TPA: gamma-glutamyl-gamma-aminobutyrate hydrolase family protein [Armatimonadota bacterium]|jgi:putative glutamine amidotransferase